MTIHYKFKNDVGSKKLPPQLVTIINLIKEAGDEGLDREALVAKLSDGNKLNTRQPVDRVLSYYHTRMEELDAVTITKPAKTPAAPREKRGKTETVVIGEPGSSDAPPTEGEPSRDGHSPSRAKAVV